MKRIGETNIPPNVYTKKQATNQEAMRIDDGDVYKTIKEVHKRDKFDKEFDIWLISVYEYDEDANEKEEESSDGELWQRLLVVNFALYYHDTKVINFLWFFLNINCYNLNLNINLIVQ